MGRKVRKARDQTLSGGARQYAEPRLGIQAIFFNNYNDLNFNCNITFKKKLFYKVFLTSFFNYLIVT